MHQIFGLSKKTNAMDSKKIRRKPKLERRNAHKYFEYDAGTSSSSVEVEDSSGLLYTRSMELYDRNDRTSFRVEGIEGELDRICKSLGLSGPEDFAIPAATWEAMKVRSSSDIHPSLKLDDLVIQEKEETTVIVAEEFELSEKFAERYNVRVRGNEAAENSGGINGIRPPVLKPPPGTRLSVVDETCSTWDLLRDLAPQGEEGIFEGVREVEEKGDEEVGKVSLKREEEHDAVDDAARIAEIVAGLSESCSFTTSNEDDSSSTATTEPRSNNVSPNCRIKRTITPGCWEKGEFLGGGSFGSVYEGMSQ